MRIQYALSEERMEEIEKIMKECGLSTKQDYLNNACALFDWAIREKQAGRDIFSGNNDGEKIKELVIPALQNCIKKD